MARARLQRSNRADGPRSAPGAAQSEPTCARTSWNSPNWKASPDKVKFGVPRKGKATQSRDRRTAKGKPTVARYNQSAKGKAAVSDTKNNSARAKERRDHYDDVKRNQNRAMSPSNPTNEP